MRACVRARTPFARTSSKYVAAGRAPMVWSRRADYGRTACAPGGVIEAREEKVGKAPAQTGRAQLDSRDEHGWAEARLV